MEDFKLKREKTKLATNIRICLPMIEEITKSQTLPVCIIGFKATNDKKPINVYFSTVSDDPITEQSLLEVFKQFIASKEKPNVEQEDERSVATK